jgi:heme/copper-type cytochrome/quinol oxidase subunit 3
VTFNTFLLLTSSWAMVMGLRQLQRDNVQGLIRWLGATAVLGTIFVLLQYYEYQQLAGYGITLDMARDSAEGFGMRFYAPTAFHGAHVIVGVLWCLVVMRRASRGRYSSRNYVGVEIFGLYWHFVDVVWIILFTLLYLV